MGQPESQQGILCHQMNAGVGLHLIVGQRGCTGILKPPRLLWRLSVLPKLTKRAYCWRKHLHNSFKMETSSQCLHTAFALMLQSLWNRRTFWIQLKINISTKPSPNRLHTVVHCLQIVIGWWYPKTCGSNQPITVLQTIPQDRAST